MLGDPAQERAAAARVTTYAQLATSRRVVGAARARLRLRESVDALLQTVTARSEGSSRLLTITAQATTAIGAARLANAIADAGQPVARIALPPTARPDAVRSAIESERYRQIVIDAPAPDRFPAGLTCGRIADASILVARQGRSSRESLAQSSANLREAGGTLLGVALLVKRGRVRAGMARLATADPARAAESSPEPA